MPTTQAPWYSTRPAATKHHNNARCVEGNNIENRHLAHGTGKLPLVQILRATQLRGKIARAHRGLAASAKAASPPRSSPLCAYSL